MRVLVISLAFAATGVLTATAARRDRDPAGAKAVAGTEGSSPRDPAQVPLDSLIDDITRHDPFRPERSPSPIRYEPGGQMAAADVPAPDPVRPAFVLRGIVRALEPRAVIEGFPGTNRPITVRAGEQRGDFQIEAIAANSVVITGADTTWTLELKAPW